MKILDYDSRRDFSAAVHMHGDVMESTLGAITAGENGPDRNWPGQKQWMAVVLVTK